jgi:hypothetical protein
MDEIFSISPTGEECCDFDPSKDEYGGSEFDSEDIITPGGGTIGSIAGAPADHEEGDEEDEQDGQHKKELRRHLINLGVHNINNKNSKAYEEYFVKHNSQ